MMEFCADFVAQRMTDKLHNLYQTQSWHKHLTEIGDGNTFTYKLMMHKFKK
jgi:hypothetical protein